MSTSPEHIVRHFRQILLWPLQLTPLAADEGGPHWQLLEQGRGDPAWYRVQDEFTADAREFQERHYKEFVAFLPYVQRFIYGESRAMAGQRPEDTPGDSALKVFRRHDVAAVRLTLHQGAAPLVLSVAHVDLCFFDDIDVALLDVEVYADDLPLSKVRDLMYRFGRAYPTGWDEAGQGVHNAYRTEWLAADGTVLAVSDSGNRAKFLSFACQHRAPCIASHWAFLLRPLALDPSEEEGALRYRQIEYHRMPLMAYLALDDPRSLPREEWLRLGLIANLHPEEALPARDPEVTEFEPRSCYDRYWTDTDAGPNTRFLCTGRALLVVGDAGDGYFRNGERGILSQFRHQYALLFLIAHFHRAALLVFSDRLVDAVHDLDIHRPESVHRFRRRVHESFEAFLRFTHRYWFHEVSERVHIQALYRLLAGRLGTRMLYDEVKEELRDMSQYMDSDAQRRQSTTVVRLTVVTTFSLVGTVATGFLGMNIIAEADAPMATRWGYFFVVLLATTALTVFTVVKSKELSELMDTLSDERLTLGQRFAALGRAWRSKETGL
jgi:hypothetical protein